MLYKRQVWKKRDYDCESFLWQRSPFYIIGLLKSLPDLLFVGVHGFNLCAEMLGDDSAFNLQGWS